MSTPHATLRLSLLAIVVALACACGSGDDSSSGDAAGANGGGGANAGSGVSAGSGAGASGSGGTQAGDGASGGTSGADAATHDASRDDASTDAGTQDAGTPSVTVCKAPVPVANAGNACPSAAPVTLTATELSTSFTVPVFVAHAPGDTSRIYVVERGGAILIVDPSNGDVLGTFVDLSGETLAATNTGGELGLLGFTFHPDFPRDPRIFVNHTVGASDAMMSTVIASYEVRSDDPDSVDVSTRRVLYDFEQPQNNHNGGMLAFGPDGCLYVGSGDGGGGGDIGLGHALGGNGQSLSTPLGKLLRFDADAPMTAAPGNLTGAGIPHIFAYGLRNPWRFSFDRNTGDLYIGDVGQSAYEEVDVAASGVGLQNYGWPLYEGLHCYGGACSTAGLTMPVSEYAQSFGDDCIVGGYVYRGAAIESLRGYYVYGDNGPGGSLFAFVWDGAGTCADPILISERDAIDLLGDISSFGEDAAGELYITTVSGALYRIDAAQ